MISLRFLVSFANRVIKGEIFGGHPRTPGRRLRLLHLPTSCDTTGETLVV